LLKLEVFQAFGGVAKDAKAVARVGGVALAVCEPKMATRLVQSSSLMAPSRARDVENDAIAGIARARDVKSETLAASSGWTKVCATANKVTTSL
jgi:hypothetical protein